MPNWIAAQSMLEIGTTRRGKYTFSKSGALAVKVAALLLTQAEKKLHSAVPAR